MKKGIYVFDFDDVLVDHAIDLYHCIRSHWRIYSNWLIDAGFLSKEEIGKRTVFNLNEWLINPKFKNLTSEEYSAVQIQIMAAFRRDFYMTRCYDKSLPTPLAQRTLMNKLFINSDTVSKVYILSRNVTETQKESKLDFINRWFDHPKIEFLNVESGQSKAEVLKKNNINWDVFVDDEIPNIRSILENYERLDKKEFLIPEFGYNKMLPDIDLLIKEKGASVSYYKPYVNEDGDTID